MKNYNVEYVLVTDLVPYEKNAKKHSREQVDRIAESIRQFGFRQNLVVDKNNVVVIGHGRLLAARQLGLQRVPCVRVEDLSDAQIKALRLADNRVAESDWDEDLLRVELDDLPDIDMSDFGFDLSEFVEEPQVVEDDFEPEIPEEPKAKRGDVYQLGRHRLMCGDSTSVDDVEKLVNGVQVDMFLTDPPYNVDVEETAGKIMNDNLVDRIFSISMNLYWLVITSWTKKWKAMVMSRVCTDGRTAKGMYGTKSERKRMCCSSTSREHLQNIRP